MWARVWARGSRFFRGPPVHLYRPSGIMASRPSCHSTASPVARSGTCMLHFRAVPHCAAPANCELASFSGRRRSSSNVRVMASGRASSTPSAPKSSAPRSLDWDAVSAEVRESALAMFLEEDEEDVEEAALDAEYYAGRQDPLTREGAVADSSRFCSRNLGCACMRGCYSLWGGCSMRAGCIRGQLLGSLVESPCSSCMEGRVTDSGPDSLASHLHLPACRPGRLELGAS